MNDQFQFEDLVAYCKAIALRDFLSPTEESVFKGLCRAYSQRFHVPLPQVYLLDPEHVIGEVFASQLEEVDVDENLEYILDQIYTLEDPEYAREKEDELKEFIDDAEEEENERLRLGKPIHRAISKAQSETTLQDKPEVKPTLEDKLKAKPKKGSVDFSSLGEG